MILQTQKQRPCLTPPFRGVRAVGGEATHRTNRTPLQIGREYKSKPEGAGGFATKICNTRRTNRSPKGQVALPCALQIGGEATHPLRGIKFVQRVRTNL